MKGIAADRQDSKAPLSAHPITILLLKFYLCTISPLLCSFSPAPGSDFLSFLLSIEQERMHINKMDVACSRATESEMWELKVLYSELDSNSQ